jgi:FkbM family methyltransferase
MEEIEFRGKKFYFNDTPTSKALISEIFNDNYKIFERGIKFEPGDVVIDIGANEGMFSIMMAKLFPDIMVIALEPVGRTFYQMMRNIGLNGVINIEAVNRGVGKEKRIAAMNVHKTFSGGSSLVDTFDEQNHERVMVTLDSIDEIWSEYRLGRVKLMKIDIEGGEYAALYACKYLNKVDNLVGEFHINKYLQSRGYDIDELATWVGARTNLVHYDRCKMAE